MRELASNTLKRRHIGYVTNAACQRHRVAAAGSRRALDGDVDG
jgi:hypothetical protein